MLHVNDIFCYRNLQVKCIITYVIVAVKRQEKKSAGNENFHSFLSMAVNNVIFLQVYRYFLQYRYNSHVESPYNIEFSRHNVLPNGTISVILVRHPVERIISCYLDKIVGQWKITQRDPSKNIFPGLVMNGSNLRETIPTFPEFVDYILYGFEGNER